MLDPPRIDPGSFRDPVGRVLLAGTKVYRVISPRGRTWLSEVWDAGIIQRLSEAGLMIETRRVTDQDEARALLAPDGIAVLEHERLPLVSYPYEWSFAGLKKAALLHLDLHLALLREGFTLGDGTAFNVQFRATRPVHIDGLDRRSQDVISLYRAGRPHRLQHGPYVFDRHCNAKPLAMWEAVPPLAEPGTAGAYRLRYEMFLEQALCASRDVMDIVKALDRQPYLRDAMIIIHGDHGSRITAETASARAELRYDEAARQRDRRGTFLAIRDGQKPGSLIQDDVRIDAVFEALVESDFESLDLSRVRRHPDSPYALPAR
jgi:hypothetical protein